MTDLVDAYDLVASVDALADRLTAAEGDGTFLSLVSRQALLARAAALVDASTDAPPASLPLYGVAVAVKDNIDVAGLPTTAACPAFAYRPEVSASAVQRLEAAGAIIVGKTNLDQFATGLVGLRTPTGPPVNPLAAELVPGGSSSGSAVAVARGLVPLALGTDTAGSGRVPAALNGIIGVKGGPGHVPTDGVVPACWSLDCVSLFCDDLALGLAAHRVLDPGRSWRLTGPVRVGVVGGAGADDALGDCDPAVRRGYEQVVASFDEAEPVDVLPLLAVGDLLYGGPFLAERTAALIDVLGSLADDDVHPVVRDIVRSGSRWTAVDAYRALHERDVQAEAVAALFRAVDVLALPTVPWLPTVDEVLADPIGTNRRLGRFTHFANLLGLAAISVPVPWVARPHPAVPLSVTVLAPTGREGLLAEAAARLTGGIGSAAAASGVVAGSIEVCVVGAHLTGFPLNGQLTGPGGTLLARTTTAPIYRLHRLAGGPVARPALERVGPGGNAIDVEVWSLPTPALGAFASAVTPPLGLGSVTLADGREVLGFICEVGGLAGAEDITRYGGWRAWSAASG